MLDEEQGEGHAHTQQLPARNPKNAILSVVLNDEIVQNGALRREENPKYRIKYTMKILQCSWRKPAPNQIP